MEVFRPVLPAKAGYVEVADENGNHIYKATPQKQAELDREQLLDDLANQLSDTDETAVELYEALEAQKDINDEQDESLVEIYELIGGTSV